MMETKYSMDKIKVSFKNDYSELAHPQVLAKLASVESTQFEGYSLDVYSLKAVELIKEKIKAPQAAVHLVSGGTQANLTVISSILRPHEAVISCETGHIFTHETGAIEATGHKICAVKGENGKLTPKDIENVLTYHTDEHMVKPKLVFVSLSTELGSIYTKRELTEISGYCKEHKLYLHVDGARLGAGISSPVCDLDYSDIARLSDTFYIGGTKNGILFGEAIVICNEKLQEDFRYYIKQKGGLLAKGASIGLQFLALLEKESSDVHDLYDELAMKANAMAMELAGGIKELGYEFFSEPETNQIFPIFPNSIVSLLREYYDFHDWADAGEDKKAIRLVVSWATKLETIEKFLRDLKMISPTSEKKTAKDLPLSDISLEKVTLKKATIEKAPLEEAPLEEVILEEVSPEEVSPEEVLSEEDALEKAILEQTASQIKGTSFTLESDDSNYEIEFSNQELRQLKGQISKLQTWAKEDTPDLEKTVKAMHEKQIELRDKLKPIKRRIKTLDEHITQANIYQRHKDINTLYKQQKNKEAFYEVHRRAITQFQAAERYFKGVLKGKSSTLPIKTWKTERENLMADRARLNREYFTLKSEADDVYKRLRGVKKIMKDDTKATQHIQTWDMSSDK